MNSTIDDNLPLCFLPSHMKKQFCTHLLWLLGSGCTFASALNVLSRELMGNASTVTNDRQCGMSMCINASVNGSTTQYVLESLGNLPFGWMAMGFGRQMVDTPMVIMWTNADGSPTLSQRSTRVQEMPIVDRSPARGASFLTTASSLSGNAPKLAFTVPTNEDKDQFVIYAFGTNKPTSSAVDAILFEHQDNGVLRLNLANTSGNPSGGGNIPFLPYQKMIIAHAVFAAVGFLVFLPFGALYARYLRTFIPTKWFQGHWIVQFLVAGISITIGVALGIQSVNEAGARHLDDTHKRWGIGIFSLYVVQCALGAVIHFVKNPHRARRPPQNYIHAIFGLLTIALSFYQVYTGFNREWPAATGRGAAPEAVRIVFWVWLGIVPFLYLAGLAFIPKQYRQESEQIRHKGQQFVGS
ncbi:hypothetical protein BJ165DRAFT_939693 [Panaeolus papilionaceus]|nr:hypothetical protein BJ165DRAFT_939693 [Panaeolus papilionaceus]